LKNNSYFQKTKVDLGEIHAPTLTIHGKSELKKYIGITLRILAVAAVIAIVAFIIYTAHEARKFKRKKLCDEMVEQVIFKMNEKARLAEKEAEHKLLDKSDTNDKKRAFLDYKPQSKTIQDLSSARNSIQECNLVY
jgi:uncharacterized membrane protein YhiD involved in acid resistance